MKYFFKLFKYLNEQNGYYNFSMIFAFNEGTFKYDDYYISEQQFINRLSQLDIQWISENVTEKIEVQQRQEAVNEFFQHLANGFKNVFGEICLKKVVERLEPHLGPNQQTRPGTAKAPKSLKLGPTTSLAVKKYKH